MIHEANRVTLRFLATGDLHAHNWKQFARTTPAGLNSRLHHILQVFKILAATAKERRIKKVLLNGDIFESADYIATDVYDAVYMELEALHQAGLEVAITVANHDISSASKARLVHTLRPFSRVAQVIEQPLRLWQRLYVIPWMEPDALKRAIAEASRRGYGHQCLVLHCAVQGAKTGPKDYLLRCPVKLKDLFPDKWDLILLSDFHKTQFLANNVLYLGSPIQHTFGETHRPRIWDVSLSDDGFRLRKIFTDSLPRFKRASIQKNSELTRGLGERLAGHYIMVHAGRAVSEQALERFSERYHFQYVLGRERQETAGAKQASKLDAGEFISRYVLANARKADARRLEDMGRSLCS
jgi:DNA repair exonuclease SbcCD nuclease subunit